MKTSKIITTLATLNLVLFMTVASIANPFARNTGDILKTGAKNQISGANSAVEPTSATSENEYSHLRFDVNSFIKESEIAELIHNAKSYLRFDVSNFIGENDTEILEMPLANDLEYLRFDVNNFDGNSSDEYTEMPVNEFDYLRFDVNRYSAENNCSMEELPGE